MFFNIRYETPVVHSLIDEMVGMVPNQSGDDDNSADEDDNVNTTEKDLWMTWRNCVIGSSKD